MPCPSCAMRTTSSGARWKLGDFGPVPANGGLYHAVGATVCQHGERGREKVEEEVGREEDPDVGGSEGVGRGEEDGANSKEEDRSGGGVGKGGEQGKNFRKNEKKNTACKWGGQWVGRGGAGGGMATGGQRLERGPQLFLGGFNNSNTESEDAGLARKVPCPVAWRNRFSGRPETWQNKRVQLGAWGPVVSNTVDGRHPTNQLRLVVYPFFPGFYTSSTITLLITNHLSEPDRSGGGMPGDGETGGGGGAGRCSWRWRAAPELHAHQPYRDAGLTIWEVATNIPSSTSSPPTTSPPHLVRHRVWGEPPPRIFPTPNTSGSLLTLTPANAFYMSEAVPASNATHPFWSLKIFVQSPFSAPCWNRRLLPNYAGIITIWTSQESQMRFVWDGAGEAVAMHFGCHSWMKACLWVWHYCCCGTAVQSRWCAHTWMCSRDGTGEAFSAPRKTNVGCL